MAYEISDSIKIAATPETVWAVLADLDNYPQWHPSFHSVTGQLAVGSTLPGRRHNHPQAGRGRKRLPDPAWPGYRRDRQGHCRRARPHPASGRTDLDPAQLGRHRQARSPTQLEDNLGGLDVQLDPAQQARLDRGLAASSPPTTWRQASCGQGG